MLALCFHVSQTPTLVPPSKVDWDWSTCHSDYEPAHPQTHAKSAQLTMLTELCCLLIHEFLFVSTYKLLSNHCGYKLVIVFISIWWNSHSMLLCGAPHKSLGMRLSTCRGKCPSTFSEGAWLLHFFHIADVESSLELLHIWLHYLRQVYEIINTETDSLKFHLI